VRKEKAKTTTVAVTTEGKQKLEQLAERVRERVAPLTASHQVILEMALDHALEDDNFPSPPAS
jgi:cell division protein ZapA (FtsZ GTPase activity inhibitor)